MISLLSQFGLNTLIVVGFLLFSFGYGVDYNPDEAWRIGQL